MSLQFSSKDQSGQSIVDTAASPPISAVWTMQTVSELPVMPERAVASPASQDAQLRSECPGLELSFQVAPSAKKILQLLLVLRC